MHKQKVRQAVRPYCKKVVFFFPFSRELFFGRRSNIQHTQTAGCWMLDFLPPKKPLAAPPGPTLRRPAC